MRISQFNSFFPIAAERHDAGLKVRLRSISALEFRDPFCHDTIERCDFGNERELFVERDQLQDFAWNGDGVEPCGIIFHVARCGSTLQAQLLKEIAGLTVYSEPRAINDVLMPPSDWNRRETVAALRIIGHLFGEHANGPFVLKLRSWNTLFCDIVAEAFPTSPWVFSIRDPVEVGVSVLTRPPTWMRAFHNPMNPFATFISQSMRPSSPEDYAARMFAAFCGAIATLDCSRGLLVNYQELPNAVWEAIIPHFAIDATDDEREQMDNVSQTYSKCALGERILFHPDSFAKQDAASSALRFAVQTTALPALNHLTETFVRIPMCV
jgi:hypothetical protein